MRAKPFTVPFEVRDYECDLQGIVNNAVYQQYLEHARHQFIKSRGLSFATLTRDGVHLVVVRAELDYKSPLRSGDRFVVGVRFEPRSPVRCEFLQEVRRVPDRRVMLAATITCAAMNARGTLIRLPAAVEALR